MKWQPIRNENYSSRDTYYSGKCSNFNENATLSIELSGNKICKFDLQPSFTSHIKECSLLKQKNKKNAVCMLTCNVFEEYKKSYDY